MSFIELEDVTKSYGSVPVLTGVQLKVEKNQVACLIGPSGCGKSTLLRCVNGLEKINSGRLWVGNVDISEELVDLNQLRKHVAMVFQQFNLFPHMNALANVSLGPRRILGKSKQESEAIAQELLERVGLGAKSHRYPDALSGGEQQRVAIARALAMRPDVLLLDEVTSALDPEMVAEVLDIVGELAAEGMTMILTTHEMEFARNVANAIHFVSDGSIYESGTPDELFANPQREKTKSFLRRLAKAGRI